MPNIFSLEVMQAKHGDCLILHYGTKDQPKLVVIDGGPAGVYTSVLKPRLMEIKKKKSPDAPLPLSMVMVSHMDDDHVNGILALTDDMISLRDDNKEMPFELPELWFNSFDDIIGNIQLPAIAAITTSSRVASISSLPGLKGADSDTVAVIASTGQGRQLRDNAENLSATVNNPFGPVKKGAGKLVRSDAKKTAIKWDDNLTITVLHPDQQRLLDLQKQWDKDLKAALKKGDKTITVASLTNSDTSPFNLSSIVCLVELNGKKILLTGDARSDDVLEGLKKNGLLDKKGKLHVDIIKIPHHGSIRNASAEFFKQVTADHYVISADGSYDNPDKPLLELFSANVTKGTLHLTNHDGKKGIKKVLDKWLRTIPSSGRLRVVFRDDDKNSFIIDLGDSVNY